MSEVFHSRTLGGGGKPSKSKPALTIKQWTKHTSYFQIPTRMVSAPRNRLETWLNFSLKNSEPGMEITWRCTYTTLTGEVLEN